MRVEFELGNRLYAVRRGRRGEPVVEVYIRPHVDTGYGIFKQKPECRRHAALSGEYEQILMPVLFPLSTYRASMYS